MSMVVLNRRSRLYRAFKPIVDGLSDLRDRRAALREPHEPLSGQWQRSHPHSYAIELVERTSGNPLVVLARAIDGVHRGELTGIALIAVGDDGVIHTAWSDGDLELMSRAAEFLAEDLASAGEPAHS